MRKVQAHLATLLDKKKIKILVTANASETKILREVNGFLHIAVSAPAHKHKANKELLKFLSKLTKKKVSLISGLTSKKKIITFS
jgi:uncharacterized protein (TIGR00251 family)